MRFALARKELRDLRPFAALGALCVGVELLDRLLKQTDQFLFSTKGSWMIFQLLLAFAIGTGLLVREQDHGTLGFLDGLPITRTQMFLTKLWTAVAVLMIYPTAEAALGLGGHLLSRDSLTWPLHPHLMLTSWALNALAAVVGLSLGMMLGYLRNLAWAAAATLATTLAVGGRFVPRLLLLDPTELLETPFIGDQWPLPMRAIGLQLGLSGLFLVIGWRLFAGGSLRLARLAEAMKRPLLSALAVLITVSALVGAMVAWNVKDGAKEPSTKDAEVAGADFGRLPLSHLATGHYTFAYQGDGTRVVAASKRADAIYEELSKELPSALTTAIDVDLTGSMNNTAGTAFWNRIRMAPKAHDLVGTLAHETIHVLANRMLADNGREELDQMQLFNEGFAELVGYRYGDGVKTQEADRLLAAVVFTRREITIEDLFDFSRFNRKHDRSLVYPLGSAFVGALISRYGADAPARLLRCLGKKDFPASLKGYALWQAAFQLAGMDLSLVVDDFWKLLAGWAGERKAQLAAFPRLRGVVEAGETALDVRVAGDKPLPEGWVSVVRFRPTASSELRDFEGFYTKKDRARRQRRDIAQDTVCFQPGLESAGDRTIYEPWQCVPVQWAKDDSALPK